MATQSAVSFPGDVLASAIPDVRTLTAAVAQFRAASQLMTTQLTRMTIDAYGANTALSTVSVALTGLAGAAKKLTGTAEPLNETLGKSQAAFVALDTTLQNMSGILQAQDALQSLDLEATIVHETLNNFLSPALTDADAGMVRLGTAADTFARTADEMLGRVGRASKIGLDQLASVVNLEPSTVTLRSSAGAEAMSTSQSAAGIFGQITVPQQPAAVQCCAGGGEGGEEGWFTSARRGTYDVYQKIASILGLMGSVADVWEALAGSSGTVASLFQKIPASVRNAIPGFNQLIAALSSGGKEAAVLAAGTIGVAMEFGVDPGAPEPRQGGAPAPTRPSSPTTPQAPAAPSQVSGFGYGSAASGAGAFGTSSVEVTVSTSPEAAREWNQVLTAPFSVPTPAPITRGRPAPRNEAAIALREARARQSQLTRQGKTQDRRGDISPETLNALGDFHHNMLRASVEAPEGFRESFDDIVADLRRDFPELEPALVVPPPMPAMADISTITPKLVRAPAPSPPRPGLYDRFIAAISEAGATFGQAIAGAGRGLSEALVRSGSFLEKLPGNLSGVVSGIPVVGRIWELGGKFLNTVGRLATDVTQLAVRAGALAFGFFQRVPGLVNAVITRIPLLGKVWTGVPDLLGKIPGMAGAQEVAGQQVKSSKDAFVGLLASFTPLGVVATLLQGVFQGVAPLVESLKEPLRIVGEILGAALAPILEALFPVFKMIAIAATWVGQIFFTIAGAILTTVGAMVKGLGKLISKLPGVGDFGLVKVGDGLINMGKGFKDSAKALAEGREKIKALEFGKTAEATQQTAEAATQANEALRNLPSGFKIALARYQVTTAEPIGLATATLPTGASTGAVAQDNRVTVQGNIVIQGADKDGRKLWEEMQREMQRQSLRQNGTTLGYAVAI